MKLGFVVGLGSTTFWLARALAHAALDADPTARRFIRQSVHLRRRHVAV